LQRARALYLKKVSEGAVNNPATSPWTPRAPVGWDVGFTSSAKPIGRFARSRPAMAAASNLEGIANFANGIRCAKNFSDAMDSKLTTGGRYVTAEIRTSFKGYYRASKESSCPCTLFCAVRRRGRRGERQAARHRWSSGCDRVGGLSMKALGHPYADDEGYVPYES
jgi:hypothetical protein